MKRILNILACAAVAIFACSCLNHEVDFRIEGNDDIVLNFLSSSTKAEDNGVESYLDHVDVIIFNYENGRPTTLSYHERIDVRGATSSILGKRRLDFSSPLYYVQVVANSIAAPSAFAGLNDYDDLMNMLQEDFNLHLTGLDLTGIPDYFLMDGVAYEGDEKPAVPGPVVLYNGVPTDNTVLNVSLERAAAKVEVMITAGNTDEFEINFADGLEGSMGELYYVRNLPYETFVIDHDPTVNTKLRTTSNENAERNAYFKWNPSSAPKSASLVTYVYAHDWKNQSILQKEPCIILNLPLVYTDKTSDPAVSEEYPNSWYKIPMSADCSFDRNMYYKVEVRVNRPGASVMSAPVELGPINYEVTDWVDVPITIGEDNNPEYLFVNKNELEIYNSAIDDETLDFYSSSNVTVTVSDVYYYDKFGARTNVAAATVRQISGTAEGLDGKVVVAGPIPDNNTVRYFTLTLTNETGQTQVVNVKHYPLVYVENILGYYSYRSDFVGSNATVPTTYDNLSSTNNIVGISYINGTYSYQTGTSGFFTSKVVRNTYPSTDNNTRKGRSDIDTYRWRNSQKSHSDYQDPGNARMYHITIMASSGEYVLGKPKITDGVTDPGEDNARLVSPSFMIASRLGVLTVSNIDLSSWNEDAQNEEYLEIYARHCEQYVEVYKDPISGETVHLDDWRLPTAAELGIIYSLQGTANASADAIDYLLNAGAYFSANGPVANTQPDTNGKSVRCVRDAY